MVIQGISYPSDFDAKKQMIEIGKKLYDRGYLSAKEGSLSVRVGPNAVWITADGTEKCCLKQESFVRVDMNGKTSPGSRNSHLPADLAVHLAVYAQNPSLRGAVHCYPLGAVTLTAMGLDVPASDVTPAVRELGRLTLSDAAGPDEKAAAAALCCRTDSGMLIKCDGLIMWGETLSDAYYRTDTLEYYTKLMRLMCRSGRKPGSRKETRGCVPAVPAEPARQEVLLDPADTFAASDIEGLTPLIRPGERLPEPAAPVERRAPQDVRDTQPEAGSPSAAAEVQPSGKSLMMEEVVRRSLMSMRP